MFLFLCLDFTILELQVGIVVHGETNYNNIVKLIFSFNIFVHGRMVISVNFPFMICCIFLSG